MDESEKRLRVLQMAQMILVEETNNRFNDVYKKWVIDGSIQPVPLPPPVPSEAEIVAKALEFYNSPGAIAAGPETEETKVTKEEDEATAAIASTGDPIIEKQPDPAESIRKIFGAPGVPIANIMGEWVKQAREAQVAQ